MLPYQRVSNTGTLIVSRLPSSAPSHARVDSSVASPSKMGAWRRRLLVAVGLAALVWVCRGWLAEVPKAQARRALAAREPEAALEWLEWANLLRAADGETEFLRARAFRRQGRLNEVRTQIERAWRLGFPLERLQREQTLAQAQVGQMREAEPMLAGLLMDPQGDAPEICEAFVNGYLLNFRFDDALQLLRTWSADFPSDALPHLVQGKIHVQRSQSRLAEKEFRRVLELDPDHAEAAYELGEVLLARKEPEAALTSFQRAAQSPTRGTEALVRQAHCLRILGRSEEALQVLEVLLRREDAPLTALLEAGKAHLDAERPADAVRILQHAQARDPDDVEVRYALAMALRGTGELEAAEHHAAWFRTAQSELSRAFDLAEQVKQRHDHIDSRLEIGRIHLKYGVRQDGVKWLYSVLNLDPRNSDAHQLLADFYTARRAEDPRFEELAERHRALASTDEQRSPP